MSSIVQIQGSHAAAETAIYVSLGDTLNALQWGHRRSAAETANQWAALDSNNCFCRGLAMSGHHHDPQALLVQDPECFGRGRLDRIGKAKQACGASVKREKGLHTNHIISNDRGAQLESPNWDGQPSGVIGKLQFSSAALVEHAFMSGGVMPRGTS